MYMYIDLYLSMYVRERVYVHTDRHIYPCTYMYMYFSCTHKHTLTDMYVCICIFRVHAQTHTCKYVYVFFVRRPAVCAGRATESSEAEASASIAVPFLSLFVRSPPSLSFPSFAFQNLRYFFFHIVLPSCPSHLPLPLPRPHPLPRSYP